MVRWCMPCSSGALPDGFRKRKARLPSTCMPSSRMKGHLPWYLTAFSGRAAAVSFRACSARRADSRSHMQWYLRRASGRVNQ